MTSEIKEKDGLLYMDEPERQDRLASFGIDELFLERVSELENHLAPRLDELLERWLGSLKEIAGASTLLSAAEEEGHMRQAMVAYIKSMLGGVYDDKYFSRRLKVGIVHEVQGVKPQWYLGAWRLASDVVEQLLKEDAVAPEKALVLMATFEKIAQLDADLALEAYFYAKSRAIASANSELGIQFKRAQESARLKEEFLSRVSHELRTPLNAVIGFSDVVLEGIDGELNEEQAHSIKKVNRAGHKLLEMINSIIHASRMSVSGVAILTPFNIMEVIESLSFQIEQAARSKGLAFELIKASPSLSLVEGDRDAFASALWSVLENGV
jgi:signal transduction histidine kinase